MTKAQVLCFLEVAKYQSFSRAASHMFVSQPAVSKQVSLLEESLSLSLIDRTPTGIQLTAAGRLFYDFFQEYFERFHQVWEQAKQLSDQKEGTLRLGCLDGWDLSSFYPELQGLLVERHPDLQVDLKGYNHIHMLDALRRGEIDIAITLELTLQPQRDLVTQVVTRAPTVALFSARNPLAQRQEVRLYDLREEPFLVIAPVIGGENPMERLTVEVCKAAGFTPRIEHVPSSAAVLLRLQSGAGVQITCAWTGACKLPLYRVLTLDQEVDICAAWLKNHSNPAKRVFVDALYSHYMGGE
jgi:DNA-binding transcriptional LysR family regulator